MTPRHGDTVGERARSSKACPECRIWIRKNSSWIARFPVPLCLGLDTIRHDGRGWRWTHTPEGAPRYPMEPREWGHQACVKRYLKREGPDDREHREHHFAVAQAREQALKDHKAEAIRDHRAAVAGSSRRRTP